MPRIAPAEPPYEPTIAAELARIMPPGVAPLVLFRTMAKSPRVFTKMFAGGLLDKGPLSLRQREIVIDRTTARLGCEYEWGVHVAFFAERVGFTPEQVANTARSERRRLLDADEQAFIGLADDLVERRVVEQATWTRLTAH
jgi:alkylhydroperoxidase family enzyme